MLLFSVAIFGSVAYVAYRRWNRSRYNYQALSRYDPDYYDRTGGRTSWLVNPHQVGCVHGIIMPMVNPLLLDELQVSPLLCVPTLLHLLIPSSPHRLFAASPHPLIAESPHRLIASSPDPLIP